MNRIPTWYDITVQIVTGVGLFNCVVFCLWYWIRTHGAWRKSEYGWFLMIFVMCLASIFSLVLANRLFGAWPYRLQVSLVLYCVYVLTTLWLPRLVWVSNQPSKAGEKQEER